MNPVQSLLKTVELSAPLDPVEGSQIASLLGGPGGLSVYPASLVARAGILYWLASADDRQFIGLTTEKQLSRPWLDHVSRQLPRHPVTGVSHVVPVKHETVRLLVQDLPLLKPRLVGLACSFGFGDRLGLATPGHVRAVTGSGMVPFFAQQSIREMARTRRSPHDVQDDAAMGVFRAGYRDGFGSDADHLKTPDDADVCLRAGFTLFTIDPGDHVDNDADYDDPDTLKRKFESLPWSTLECSAQDCRSAFAGRSFTLPGDVSVKFSDETLLRAAVKYGRAVAHTAMMYRHIASRVDRSAFELEVSVDETATPTTVAEHLFVASELKRMSVQWVSLAPRFVGDFEKGVDYKGDLDLFERTFAGHVAVARHVGPYKISLHSGSDKFSVYPITSRLAGDLVHVKTAGTSYLEALRVLARVETGLFREILTFCHERYETDKATYHVSADIRKVPQSRDLGGEQLPALLDQFDARQLLHVTYGSVLTADDGNRFRTRLLSALRRHDELYAQTLQHHLGKHVTPFSRK